MKTELRCIPCAVNSYLRLVEAGDIPESRQEENLRRLLELLSRVKYDQSPPVLGRMIHKLIRETLGNPDPYLQIKEKYNRLLLDLYASFEEMVKMAEDPIDTAIRLAIAGNVVDFGAHYQMDVMDTIKRVMKAELAIDDSTKFRKALRKAKKLVYIGDNCGEIVLDKLLLESINLPEMYYVVRDGPIINDATILDASTVGIDKVAKVITTGDDSPGAVWESVSEEFKDHFGNADVVISKGQGNLEGLMNVSHDNIYFLLTIKCELIGELIGARKGDFVFLKGKSNFTPH